MSLTNDYIQNEVTLIHTMVIVHWRVMSSVPCLGVCTLQFCPITGRIIWRQQRVPVSRLWKLFAGGATTRHFQLCKTKTK